MTTLEIFDPPMCCVSGICGESEDPTLVIFASDLEWLKMKGINVLRHNLSFEPTEFAKHNDIKELLNSKGNDSLPILKVDDKIVSQGYYPTREQLSEFCNIEFNNDDAPPIHREENCCCGVDCDCSKQAKNEFSEKLFSKSCGCGEECDCTNAAAEDNCYCTVNSEDLERKKDERESKVLVAVLVIAIVGLIAIKVIGG